MKTSELIKVVANDKNKMLKPEQLKTVLKKELEVKEYIGIKDKKELVDNIVNECILYENGVFKFNDIDKYICFTMRVIETYTNLELSDDMEDDYDMLCQSNLLEIVIDLFKKEYDDVNILLQMKSEYILSHNTLEAQLGNFLNEILSKLDDISDIAIDKMKDFDINKLPISKKDLMKLFEFINK